VRAPAQERERPLRAVGEIQILAVGLQRQVQVGAEIAVEPVRPDERRALHTRHRTTYSPPLRTMR